MIGTIWRAIRHMGHNDIGVMNPSGNGGRSSGDEPDAGDGSGQEGAGEAERHGGGEGNSKEADVQSGLSRGLIA